MTKGLKTTMHPYLDSTGSRSMYETYSPISHIMRSSFYIFSKKGSELNGLIQREEVGPQNQQSLSKQTMHP